ncbi:hypothetical protein [Chitinibacter tainanensis]|uniref:hypothetical protein n=1 Tax=Chitinibacter tainanensis TaxID=230667 RepID=UPI002353C06D|nr:hypothetical protein [Chitinibacter tainanensis]
MIDMHVLTGRQVKTPRGRVFNKLGSPIQPEKRISREEVFERVQHEFNINDLCDIAEWSYDTGLKAARAWLAEGRVKRTSKINQLATFRKLPGWQKPERKSGLEPLQALLAERTTVQLSNVMAITDSYNKARTMIDKAVKEGWIRDSGRRTVRNAVIYEVVK